MRTALPPVVFVVLFALGLFLPMAAVVAFGLSGILNALQDAWGAVAAQRVALGLAALWLLDLVLLLLAQTWNALVATTFSPHPQDETPPPSDA